MVEVVVNSPVPGNVQVFFPELNADHATVRKPAGEFDRENPCSASLIQDAARFARDCPKNFPFPPEVETKGAQVRDQVIAGTST